ncbi:MAG: ABC transporter substrate-binding protein [Proteobacteria bacterium]|nr:ABC transporter substrate-binding protein [Pseudomonadota bacterium]
MKRIGWIAGLALLATAGWATTAAAQGTLRTAIGSNLNTLDPARSTIGEEYIYDHLVFNGLTRIDAELLVKPDLAERWENSADLKVWTFHLRHGVKFHHGRELDAEDAVATFKRILDPVTASRGASALDMVSNVEAVGTHSVRFTLKYPYAGFQDIFGERQLKIVPRDRLDALATQPVGTGPFMFKSYTPSDRMELVKNPNYFEPGVPKLDGIVLRIIPETAARLAALQSGAIDLLWNLPLESIETVKRNPALKVDSVATATWDGIILNNARPPFNDLRVRQALALTIDKDQLVQLALFGNGAPTHSPIPPSHGYFAKDVPIGKPDVEKAKKLLAEAGYPNGFEVPLQVPQEREARVRLGVAVRDMAQKAGIRINVERVPFASYTENVAGKAQMYVDGYFARPTIDTAVYPFYHSSGSWNTRLWNYKNDLIDKLLDQSRVTQDEAARRKLFTDFQKIASDTVPSIIAYSANHVNGLRNEVKGFHSTPMMWLELKEVSIAK